MDVSANLTVVTISQDKHISSHHVVTLNLHNTVYVNCISAKLGKERGCGWVCTTAMGKDKVLQIQLLSVLSPYVQRRSAIFSKTSDYECQISEQSQ